MKNIINTEDGKRGFQQVYTEDDFLNAMELNIPITQNSIVRLLNCSVPTAKKYLEALEAQGKVRKIIVIGGHDINWERIS